MIERRPACEGPRQQSRRARTGRRAPGFALARLVGLLAALPAVACYRPAHVECTLRCGPAPDRACPDGTMCLADGYCHRPGSAVCTVDGPGSVAGGDGAQGPAREAGPGGTSS